MSYLTACAIVLAAGLGAARLTLFVRRRVHIDALRRHHEIGSAVFLQMGVVFAVLLAFVFNQVWSQYNDADEAIAQECGSLRVVALLADNLTADAAQTVKNLVAGYVSSVIHDEWPAMAQRQDSTVSEAKLRDLALAVTRLPTAPPQQSETRSEIITFLSAAQTHRETRLYQMTSGLPATLWFMLLAFGSVLTCFLFFFGMENLRSQMVFTGVFAGAIALVMVILSLLNYPFEGAMALQPTAFAGVLAHIASVR